MHTGEVDDHVNFLLEQLPAICASHSRMRPTRMPFRVHGVRLNLHEYIYERGSTDRAFPASQGATLPTLHCDVVASL